ncbi:MAG: hypothetical protein HYV07_20170 [Deltaproteobacteria bacterium]|nr:hypothetical protein [Deltaproteobacteria bacterium]
MLPRAVDACALWIALSTALEGCGPAQLSLGFASVPESVKWTGVIFEAGGRVVASSGLDPRAELRRVSVELDEPPEEAFVVGYSEPDLAPAFPPDAEALARGRLAWTNRRPALPTPTWSASGPVEDGRASLLPKEVSAITAGWFPTHCEPAEDRRSCPITPLAGRLVCADEELPCDTRLRQTGCALTVDLSGCGLPSFSGPGVLALADEACFTREGAGCVANGPSMKCPTPSGLCELTLIVSDPEPKLEVVARSGRVAHADLEARADAVSRDPQWQYIASGPGLDVAVAGELVLRLAEQPELTATFLDLRTLDTIRDVPIRERARLAVAVGDAFVLASENPLGILRIETDGTHTASAAVPSFHGIDVRSASLRDIEALEDEVFVIGTTPPEAVDRASFVLAIDPVTLSLKRSITEPDRRFVTGAIDGRTLVLADDALNAIVELDIDSFSIRHAAPLKPVANWDLGDVFVDPSTHRVLLGVHGNTPLVHVIESGDDLARRVFFDPPARITAIGSWFGGTEAMIAGLSHSSSDGLLARFDPTRMSFDRGADVVGKGGVRRIVDVGELGAIVFYAWVGEVVRVVAH